MIFQEPRQALNNTLFWYVPVLIIPYWAEGPNPNDVMNKQRVSFCCDNTRDYSPHRVSL